MLTHLVCHGFRVLVMTTRVEVTDSMSVGRGQSYVLYLR